MIRQHVKRHMITQKQGKEWLACTELYYSQHQMHVFTIYKASDIHVRSV